MVWSWIDECASAEHAKIFTDIAPNPKYSYRSRHGRSHRAGQNPVVGNHSDLRFDLCCGPAMNMSYKRAWDLVDDINRICRRAAVERQKGGKDGGGAILTPFGLSLVTRYRKIERSIESAAREELLALRADVNVPKKA